MGQSNTCITLLLPHTVPSLTIPSNSFPFPPLRIAALQLKIEPKSKMYGLEYFLGRRNSVDSTHAIILYDCFTCISLLWAELLIHSNSHNPPLADLLAKSTAADHIQHACRFAKGRLVSMMLINLTTTTFSSSF